MVITILLAVALAIALLALGVCVANLSRYRPAAPPGRSSAMVSVCVPARNEAANLEPCVRSLLAQSHAACEILVYDDQSSDETPSILRRLCLESPRVRAVETAPLPPGWNGKQWGCDRMGRAAEGAWVLFTDADVRFEPQCVARTLAEAERGGVDLLSTFPRQLIGSFGEALLVPMIHFVLLSYLPMGRMRSTPDPAASAGCGQFLFARRAAWLAAGGHAAFKASMHDGIKLPRAMRSAGFRTDLFDGTELVRCRMYHGFAAAWRGFVKNAYEGLGSLTLLIVVTALHVLGHLFPWAFMIWAAITGGGTAVQWGLASAAAIVAIGERLLLARRFHQPAIAALLHPVGVLLMTMVQWQSALLHATGRRSWKGRTLGEADAGGAGDGLAAAAPGAPTAAGEERRDSKSGVR